MSRVILRRALFMLVVAVLVLVVVALAWHLVGMDHRDDMGMLGACVAVLAVVMLLLRPSPRPHALRVGAPDAPAAGFAGAVPGPVARPPPREGTVLLD